ncbi:MAG TPA: type II secretion system protein GspG [Myxococcota bacterium]|nr:type II secretion system protein GspG [Myxococcota bacterium]
MPRPVATALVLLAVAPLLGAKSLPSIARTQIILLEGALEAFRIDHGRYPTTDEGLAALAERPEYLWSGRVPVDPWGRPFLYRSPGERNPERFDLGSLGADGAPGGDGIAADIGNWPGGFAALEGMEREGASHFPFLMGLLAGGAVGLPIYLYGVLSAALGRRSWSSAVVGAPLITAISLILACMLVALWFPSID